MTDTERIAELEAALEGEKVKVAILDNMVKQRDKQVDGLILRERKLTAERDRTIKALKKLYENRYEPDKLIILLDRIAREAREGK